MKVHLLTIGDELLIGQVVDNNSAWMGRQLNLAGIQVAGIVSAPDEHDDIVDAIGHCLQRSQVVIMTGGLGPTKDDVTKKAIAEYYGVGFVFSQETYERLVRIFQRLGRPVTEALRQQCFMPQNAELLLNHMGTAPGMWMEENGRVLISLPGVPYEMKHLMETAVIPRLLERFPVAPRKHRTVLTAGEGESTIADRLEKFEDELPADLRLAYLPSLGQVRLRLTATGHSEPVLDRLLETQVARLQALLPDLIYGYEAESLEEAVGRILRERGLRLATAESCTGGYLAHRITSVPGSSDYFLGSVVAYANEIKIAQLGVAEATLQTHGAVSEQTVREMAEGVRQRFGADIAVATSGVAGPGGGSPEKPVGTIWLAVADRERTFAYRLQAGKDREKNIQWSTVYALNFLRRFALGEI